MEKKSVFETLSAIDVSDHIEKKNGLSYLSWAWAWYILLKFYPSSTSEVYEDQNGRPWFDDGRSGWVKVSVTVEGITHTEYLPVMDNRNKSIPAERIDSFAANTAIQRCRTKAIGRHGLGISLYAGEDLPLEVAESKEDENPSEKAQKPIVKKDKHVDEESNKPLTDLQASTLKMIVNKYGNEALNVVNEFKVAMEIPSGAKLTQMQAGMLMQTFFSRGMRP